MLTNSGIATIYIDICILLFILTLKATQQLMPEILFIMYVSVRNNAEACVSRIMHETWYVCNVYLHARKTPFLTSFFEIM